MKRSRYPRPESEVERPGRYMYVAVMGLVGAVSAGCGGNPRPRGAGDGGAGGRDMSADGAASGGGGTVESKSDAGGFAGAGMTGGGGRGGAGNASGGSAGVNGGFAGAGTTGGGDRGGAGNVSGGSAGVNGGFAGAPAVDAGSADAKSWYPQDISFVSTANKANPYSDVTDFRVTFRGPNSVTLTIPGFYTGNSVWKVRFSLPESGTFTYVTSSAEDPSLNGISGTVPPAVPNPNGHGALEVDPAHPHHYLYSDGTRPFQMGYELDWLGLMDFGDAAITKATRIIDTVAANGFTEVLMNAYAYDTSWEPGTTSAYDFGPPAAVPWPGTNAAPDQTKLNQAFWQSYDRVIAYLFEKGLTAHIYFRVYTKMVNWPANASPNDDLYFAYIVARYQAYSNVVWDFSKESYYEKDQGYIASRLKLIGATDAYHRLRTLHDPDGGQNQLSPNYYDNPAYAGTVDFYTDQSSDHYAAAVAALKKRSMPYYNAETTLYQVGNDGAFTYGHYNPAADVFAASMEVVMAGGYFAFYYSLHAWDVDKYSEVPNAIGAYKTLVGFMTSTRWYALTANDGLIGGGAVGRHCLASPGTEYIVYEAGPGSVTLTIAGAINPLAAKWVDLSTGAESVLAAQSNGTRAFSNPWSDPAVLYLRAP
ncbi:MAG TPA: DUF5060 domain-containing protein [Polyangia bacterium]|nr:DUF5060 domain-containing protein [Polyangia bacterium]